MKLKKITATFCTCALMSTTMSFASTSAEQRAQNILSQMRVSKNDMLRTHFEEIIRLQGTISEVQEMIEEFRNNDFTSHNAAQISSVVAFATFSTMVAAANFTGKQKVLIIGGAGALAGAQYYLSSFADDLSDEQIESMGNSLEELDKTLAELQKEEVNLDEINELRGNLVELSNQQKDLLNYDSEKKIAARTGYVLGVVTVMSSALAFLGTSYMASGIYTSSLLKLGLQVAALGSLISGGTIAYENYIGMGNTLDDEDFKRLNLEIDNLSTRLDNLVLKIQSHMK